MVWSAFFNGLTIELGDIGCQGFRGHVLNYFKDVTFCFNVVTILYCREHCANPCHDHNTL